MSGYRSDVALPTSTRSARIGLIRQRASERAASFPAALNRAGSLPTLGAVGSAGFVEPSARWPIPFGDQITSVARQVGISPALVAAVVDAESGFNPQAVSTAGAKGLMQLMDATARGLGVANAFDPQQNLLGGARFLQSLLGRYGGDLTMALAAYNAGPVAVDRYGGVPPYAETQRYVPKVLAAYQKYQAMLG